jgi:FMNH2-dependent dimethyl sulfone monooxygenase
VRYGFWTPVFGGWLRNVPDEGMDAHLGVHPRLCQRAEQIGYDLTLVAELNLNDIKGPSSRRSTPGRRPRPGRGHRERSS